MPRRQRSEVVDEPPLGVQRWLISCDETGVNGNKFYGFGSLWMPWQRRGDFARLIADLREQHGYNLEIKWTHVKDRWRRFYCDLIDRFFVTRWLWFHCLLVEKSVVRKELHKGSYDLARRKHLTMLLTNKVGRSLRTFPTRHQTFRVWIDPIHTSSQHAEETVEIVGNHILRKVAQPAFDGVYPHDSCDTPSIQVSDLLLGAVGAAFEGDAVAAAKIDLQQEIAAHLGWKDLRGDTAPSERKFNVWVFYDPTRNRRRAETRRVTLR